MKKLKLEIETLSVQSFATGAASVDAGTVHAHAATRNQATCQSCQNSCELFTCDASCQFTACCVPTEPEQTCIYPCVPPPITNTVDCGGEVTPEP